MSSVEQGVVQAEIFGEVISQIWLLLSHPDLERWREQEILHSSISPVEHFIFCTSYFYLFIALEMTLS